jgi:Ca-activated chloride channel family protein
MKKLLIILFIILHITTFASQTNISANDYFFSGAKEYCNNKIDQALSVVEEGLSKFPNDEKLKKLEEKIKQKKKEEEEKKKKEEEKKKKEEQQKKDQQKKDQQQNGDDKKEQNQQGQDKKDEQGQGQQPKEQPGQMTKEQAEKLLEAMQAEEGKVQQKLAKEKGKPVKGKVQKDW